MSNTYSSTSGLYVFMPNVVNLLCFSEPDKIIWLGVKLFDKSVRPNMAIFLSLFLSG